MWTKGPVRSPLGLRFWHQGGPSQSGLAPAWLSDARHRLRCRPGDVLFAAWDPCRSRLQRSRDAGGDVVCRLKRKRRCNGHAMRQQRRHPYGTERGWLSGGRNVRVVSDGKPSSATNRLTLAAVEVRRLSRVRAPSAERMRVGTDQLGLAHCHARSARAQQQQIACCLSAVGVLARERPDRPLRLYRRKRRLSVPGQA